METVGLRPSRVSVGKAARSTGRLPASPRAAIGGLLLPPSGWRPEATRARRERCRPYPSFSMGSVGLRLCRSSIGKAGRSIGRLHISPRRAVGGLLLPPSGWQPEVTLAWRELCRPYPSFSMETVGLRLYGGSIGQVECSIRRLNIWPRGAAGGPRLALPSWQAEARVAERQRCRPYLSFSMGTVGLRRSGGSIGHVEL